MPVQMPLVKHWGFQEARLGINLSAFGDFMKRVWGFN